MTVFLAGAFGQGNPGDEALLSAFSRALGHLDPVASTCDPQGTEAAHGVTAVDRDDVPRVGREIARADAVVVAGGTIFKTLHPSSGRAPLSLLRRTAALATLTRALRKPLALVGVGAAPIHGPGRAPADALDRPLGRPADPARRGVGHAPGRGRRADADPRRRRRCLDAGARAGRRGAPGGGRARPGELDGSGDEPASWWRSATSPAAPTSPSGSPPAWRPSWTPTSPCGSTRGSPTATPSWPPRSPPGCTTRA